MITDHFVQGVLKYNKAKIAASANLSAAVLVETMSGVKGRNIKRSSSAYGFNSVGRHEVVWEEPGDDEVDHD